MKKTMKSFLAILLALVMVLSLTVTGITAVSAAAKPLYAPTNVRIQNSGTGFKITWNKAANAAGYRVFYKTAESDWAYADTNTNSVNIPNLEYGTLYYIQVQTIGSNNARGNFTKATSMTHVRGTTLENAEYKAENNEETANLDRTITLEWDKADGANGYAIAKYKTGNLVGYFYTADTTYTDTAIVAGSQYAYQINPYYTNGKSAAYAYWSNVKVLTTLLQTKIQKIETSPATTPANININWERVDGAKGYILSYLCSKGDKLEDMVGKITTSSTYYNIKFPPKDAIYSFWVRPINGKIEGPDSYLPYYKVESLKTPQNINIESTYEGMTIGWDNADDATGYQVAFKRSTDTAWNKRITTNPTYTVPNPTPGAKYFVQVRALCEPINNKENKYVVGDYSVPANSHDIKPLGVPTITDVDSTYDNLTFKWSGADGATSYDVAFRRENVDPEGTWHHKTATVNTLSVDKPTPGATYTVKVRAVRGNNYGEYSNTSEDAIPILGTPVITNVNATIYQMTIDWDNVDDATGYTVAFKRSTDKAWNFRTTTNPTYTIPNPTKGATYYIQVKALCGTVEGNYTKVNTQVIPEKDPHEGLTYYEAGETVKVTHPAETELVWVVDEAAHDETKTEVKSVYHYRICQGCGAVGDGWTAEQIKNHDWLVHGISPDDDIIPYGKPKSGYVNEPVDTILHVSEKGHYEVQVIKEAWSENVVLDKSGWYKTVVHPAETAQAKVIDKAAYWYEEPVYEYVYKHLCWGCDAEVSNNVMTDEERLNHMTEHHNKGEISGYRYVKLKIQTGKNKIEAPETYHIDTVVIKESWNELVFVTNE